MILSIASKNVRLSSLLVDMRVSFVRCWLFFGSLFILLSACFADFATPFVDVNNELGDISEARARVAALGPTMASPFLVIIMNDELQPVVLWAKAKKGVIRQSLLGREIRIKAVITKTGTASANPEVEILQAKPLKENAGRAGRRNG